MIVNRKIIALASKLESIIANTFRRQAYSHKLAYCFSKQTDLEKISKKIPEVDTHIPDLDRPSSSHGGIYDIESTMDRSEVSEELQVRMQDLRIRHELLRVELSKKINIPFCLCGINRKTYHESFSYMPDRVMSYYRIHSSTITDYLLKIYKASLYAIIDKNQEFMNQYWQQGFKEKVLASLQTAKGKDYTLKLTQQKKFTQEMKESCKIVDAVMLRGLSMNRKENQKPSDYHKYAQDTQFGLITYTPLSLTDGQTQKFINPDQNKTAYQGYQKMVLRVLVLIKTPLRLTVPQLPVPGELNTYQHLAVLENQMLAPAHLQSRYKLQTLVQWLGKYRFGAWNLVDIDNFMKGNSPFRLHRPQQQEIDQVFRNTIIDKSYYCNIRKI